MELVSSLMIWLRLALVVVLAGFISGPLQAEDAPVHHHALSLIGEPKYPADFTHFDFVNPDAPKGGNVRMADIGSFDSLNPVLYRGEPAAGLSLVYESLMADSLDEPSTSYGLIAERSEERRVGKECSARLRRFALSIITLQRKV